MGDGVIIDDSQQGFSTSGPTWTRNYQGQGYLNTVSFAPAGTGNDAAAWAFAGLAPGAYRVSVTWSPHANRATNAPYSVNGGAPVLVNQQQGPSDFVDHGVGWKDVGTVT